jgi:hypothetical protein
MLNRADLEILPFSKNLTFKPLLQTADRESKKGGTEMFGDCRHRVQQIQKPLKE